MSRICSGGCKGLVRKCVGEELPLLFSDDSLFDFFFIQVCLKQIHGKYFGPVVSDDYPDSPTLSLWRLTRRGHATDAN